MPGRDPEAKKRRLLDAALQEFSARGLAGSPVDVIARRAACSPGLVYTYFGSKEGLFDAVLDDIAQQTSDTLPLDVDDLPGYAVALHEANVAHPEVVRFVAWYQLERASGGGEPSSAMGAKVQQIADAQSEGRIPDVLPAPLLLLSLQAISRMWVTEPVDVLAAIDPAGDEVVRREYVRAAVQRLVLAPGPEPRARRRSSDPGPV